MKDCIELIIEQANQDPHKTCVVQGGITVTYGEFVQRSLQVAAFLQRNQYRKVVVNMPQGISSYIVIVGILMAGGYYCPLNMESPPERKKWIINEFKPDVIITLTQTELPAVAPLPIKFFEEIPESISTIKDIDYNPTSLAYVIYTSGSTGNPKGVRIKRSALNKFLAWSIPTFDAGEVDRWAQYSYLSFDLSIVDIFTALCSGSILVAIAERGQKVRPANSIVKYGITVWHSVPGVIDYLMLNENSQPADLSSLRIMSFCGEPLYERHLDYLFGKNPNLKVFNTYGPTEGTLFCSWIELTKENYREYSVHNISIGNPIPAWSFYLTPYQEDKLLQELSIYGDYLAEGYLNFPNTPFVSLEIEGQNYPAYLTGDLVEVVNGSLYFAGRIDNQIKLRGNRIDLEEIDHWISKATNGCKSVSLVYQDALHSFVEAGKINEEEIRNVLRENLEPVKIPAYIYSITSLPRNDNSKIDRSKLIESINGKGKAY